MPRKHKSLNNTPRKQYNLRNRLVLVIPAIKSKKLNKLKKRSKSRKPPKTKDRRNSKTDQTTFGNKPKMEEIQSNRNPPKNGRNLAFKKHSQKDVQKKSPQNKKSHNKENQSTKGSPPSLKFHRTRRSLFSNSISLPSLLSLDKRRRDLSSAAEKPLCDLIDEGDDLFSTDAAEAAVRHCLVVERKVMPQRDYMAERQPDLRPEMRGLLVGWLLEVQQKFRLRLESVFAAVRYLDRFLAKRALARGRLQVVGCACLLVACKMEEVAPPLLRNFVYICDGATDVADMRKMESIVLETLDWRLATPTAIFFAKRFLRVAGFLVVPFPTENEAISKTKDIAANVCLLTGLLLELSLTSYSFVGFCESETAASAVLLAVGVFAAGADCEDFLRFAGKKGEALEDCVVALAGLLQDEGEAGEFVRRKYAQGLNLEELAKITFFVNTFNLESGHPFAIRHFSGDASALVNSNLIAFLET